MKYKVGDRVRVKKGLVPGSMYGDTFVVESMLEYAGKFLTIKGKLLSSECYVVEENGWW